MLQRMINTKQLKKNFPTHDDIVKVLQDKYKSTQSKSEKIMILTIFVAQWSNRRVRREFNCSHQLISQRKKVLITKGVLSTPNPKKKGKPLPVHVKDMVKEFIILTLLAV